MKQHYKIPTDTATKSTQLCIFLIEKNTWYVEIHQYWSKFVGVPYTHTEETPPSKDWGLISGIIPLTFDPVFTNFMSTWYINSLRYHYFRYKKIT